MFTNKISVKSKKNNSSLAVTDSRLYDHYIALEPSALEKNTIDVFFAFEEDKVFLRYKDTELDVTSFFDKQFLKAIYPLNQPDIVLHQNSWMTEFSIKDFLLIASRKEQIFYLHLKLSCPKIDL